MCVENRSPVIWALCLAVLFPVVGSALAAQEDFFFRARLDELQLVELPEEGRQFKDDLGIQSTELLRVRLDDEGEAWLESASNQLSMLSNTRLGDTTISIRSSGVDSVSGSLVLPHTDRRGFSVLRFRLGPEYVVEGARETFFEAKTEYYERLLRDGRCGAAWFRHQVRQAKMELGKSFDEPRINARPTRATGLEEAYEIFSGGRALAENLRLDRIWQSNIGTERIVDIDKIAGIEIEAYDWDARLEGLEPELDPLAAWIPEDQHALFFPSFAGLVAVLDEGDRLGTPLLRFMDPRPEDARTRERYERQLCLELDQVGRLLGPAVIRSVVMTGSDPYLRTGTDVALIFECSQPELLYAAVVEKQKQVADVEGRPMRTETDDKAMLEDFGWEAESGDTLSAILRHHREPSSLVVQRGKFVIVANSVTQVKRILAARSGSIPVLSDSPEYRFFRDRYKRGSDDESAFLMLTDATIRRWCGPKWRIGSARRIRAAALLSEYQARMIDERVEGAEARFLDDVGEAAGLGSLTIFQGNLVSSIYGSLSFLTPILELDIEQVTREEQTAYNRFRDSYQRDWRTFFDPIAVRFQMAPDRLGLDVSVMPLVEQSDYDMWINLAGDAAIRPDSGDPHPESLIHFAMALSRESRTFRNGGGMAGMFLPGVRDPLGWVGDSISLYFDRDPVWKELLDADDEWSMIEKKASVMPIGLHVTVDNPLLLVGFLTGLRGFSDQSAPGMTNWENRDYNGQTYVSVGATDDFDSGEFGNLRLNYVILPTGLTLSLNEELIHRAIDRAQAQKLEDAEAPVMTPWLGKSLGLRVASEAFKGLVPVWFGSEYLAAMRLRSWSNLTILNEWHALYPDRDPVEVHASIWKTRLVCPGGGEYVWDEATKSMQSTVFGSPLNPIDGGELPELLKSIRALESGLTFEDDGVRAQFLLHR